MIVSFSVSNFRSFLSEETFSLVASSRLSGGHEEHTTPIPDCQEQVLRTAIIYGANGAGKSNLFKALRYFKALALGSTNKNNETGRIPFRFQEVISTPSTFELHFITNNKLYQFGVKVTDNQILEEWLIQKVGNREKIIYERISSEDGKVTVKAPGLKSAGEKIKALVTVGGPKHQTFLATVNVTLDEPSRGKELSHVINWFNRSLILIGPDDFYASLGHLLATDNNFKKFAGEFLKYSSTGVDHLKVNKKEITEDNLRTLLPESLVSRVLKDITKDENGQAVVRLSNGNELFVERTDQNHYYSITIHAAHELQSGKFMPLELSNESDGTRRLLNLIPALHRLRTTNTVYFIDEIDRSMHPILVRKFLEFFLKSCEVGQRQIIVTTHESNLLDLDLVRRDEIWFAEKDHNAATKLYSLVDFKVRKDLEIRKHYLQGRFGAIPFLGNLDQLLTENVR